MFTLQYNFGLQVFIHSCLYSSEFCYKMECVCVKYEKSIPFPWSCSTVVGDDLTESLALEWKLSWTSNLGWSTSWRFK